MNHLTTDISTPQAKQCLADSLSGLQCQDDVSVDDFLGGKLRLIQPLDGYRVSMDTILLAATIPAKAGETVLEPGMGSGGAALSLAHRVAGVQVTGLELQPVMADLGRRNIALNAMQDQVNVFEGDLTEPHPEIKDGSFDHVMANPPYLTPGRGMRPPSKTKGLSHMMSSATLKDWLNFCIDKARYKGTITIIHRTDMLQDVIARLHKRVGELTLLPLWPRAGVPAKRFILQGRKGMHGGMTVLNGLEMHGEKERYTKQAEKILRDGGAIDLKALAGRAVPAK